MADTTETIKYVDGTALGEVIAKVKGQTREGPFFLSGATGTAAVTSSPYRATKWEATEPRIGSLYDGLTVILKIPVSGNGSYGSVLDVNGLGFHPVARNVNTHISTTYPVGSIVILVYDSDQTMTAYYDAAATDGKTKSAITFTGVWKVADYDTTNIKQLRKDSGSYKTKSVLYRYQLCFEGMDGTLIPANGTSNSTAKTKTTITQETFNPFGPIYYYSSTTTVSAGGVPAASSLYEFVAVNTRYSFNSTLVANEACYLKAIPQADGGAKMVSSSGTGHLVTDLPTQDDGYIYIYLGQASSTTTIELSTKHPVYWFKQGKLRPYTGFGLTYGELSGTPTVPTKVSDLTNDSGFTSNVGTITGIKMNGASKGTSGVVDLGTVITAHQDISGKADLVDGKVPSSQLPSYVDDVLEYSAKASFPSTGETGKIYVDTSTNKTYRWGGSAYVEISPSLALGETASTAFAGNRGVALETAVASKYEKPSGGIPSSDLAESYYLASNPSGFTSNEGTVKSVRVQAGTGLSSSTSTAQSATLNTTISIASGYKLPTTTEWNSKGTYSKPSGGIPASDLADTYLVASSDGFTYSQSSSGFSVRGGDSNYITMEPAHGSSATTARLFMKYSANQVVFTPTQLGYSTNSGSTSTYISYSDIATKTELASKADTSSLGATHWDGAILNLFSDGSGNVVSFYGSLHYLKADRTLCVKGIIRVRAQGSNASNAYEIPITPMYDKLGLSASNVESTQGLHWIGTGIPWSGTDIVSDVMGAGEIIFLAEARQTIAIGRVSNVNSGALSLWPISTISTAAHTVDFMIHFTS